MKIKFLTFCLASVLLSSPTIVNAGNTVSEVEKILFYDGGKLIYIYPKGGVKNPPSCHDAVGGGDYYSFSSERPMAKEYISGLLSAQARKATVQFWGKGACIDQAVAETLNYFRIEN
jgi:hypothetical protein